MSSVKTADTLSSLGENEALRRIFPRLPDSRSTVLGPGDDAAIVAAPDGRFVVTTDMMIHGPDFRLAWSTPHDLGWKAAASNLSDIAAMGAVPTALVVALAVPADTPVLFLEGIADGLRDACEALAPGCGVVGGDLSVSTTMTIAVTAFGDLEGRDAVTRSGAQVGDVIAVSGALGEAAAALHLLFAEGVDAGGQPEVNRAAALRDRTAPQLRPSPPIADGPAAALAGATSMLDLSDGLAKDAARIAVASEVTFDLFSLELGADPLTAFHGGEDHSLLATFRDGAELPGGFRSIGIVLPVGKHPVLLDGNVVDAGGWDPYRGWSGALG